MHPLGFAYNPDGAHVPGGANVEEDELVYKVDGVA